MPVGVDLLKRERQAQNPGRPNPARGRVTRAPSSAADSMDVHIWGWPRSQSYTVPATNWSPRPNPVLDDVGGAGPPVLPNEGASCLIVFDHVDDAWVPVWGVT